MLRVNPRKLLLLLIIITSVCILNVLYRLEWSQSVYSEYESLVGQSASGCDLPHLDPWDPSIQQFLTAPQILNCTQNQLELTSYDAKGTLVIDEKLLAQIDYQLSCFYRCYTKLRADDGALNYTEWKQFKKAIELSCEFVEVYCSRVSLPHTTVYSNNHHRIVRREGVSQRSGSDLRPSVILLVMDSVSQSNWRRSLPKSLEVLKSIYNSYIFDGMTKVGDHSFPNAVAFLSGKEADREFGDVTGFFDNHPLIWKDYQLANYTTYYAEDYPGFNLFYYLAKGFYKQPVHHYFRPFWVNVYGSFVHRRSTNLCYGNNKMHNIELNYLSQYLNTYTDSPVFALNWLTELGHDYSNQVSMGDDDIARFLTEHHDRLRDSFVFVLSDHGHRFDPIRETAVGRLEERLPFFSMHIPNQLAEKYPQLGRIVNKNMKVLTTFWDFYVTLRDILHLVDTQSWHELGDANLTDVRKTEQRYRKYSKRGMSLLRPIPNRSCRESSIPEEFCVCTREANVEVTDQKVARSSAAVVSHLNRLLSAHRQCAVLSLSQTRHAQVALPARGIAAGPLVTFRVALETSPSGGVFEALVRHDARDHSYFVVGDVNRINRYGNQSLCVDSQRLRKYCYCI